MMADSLFISSFNQHKMKKIFEGNGFKTFSVKLLVFVVTVAVADLIIGTVL